MTSYSSSKVGKLILVNARSLPRMVCVKEDETKEGAYAFTDESYHIEQGCPRAGIAVPARCKAVERSWLVMQGRCRFECCTPRCISDDLGLCCPARHGRCAERSSRLHRVGRTLA